MCSPEGTAFDLTNILPWLKKHGTNPVTGAPLAQKDLIKLHFTKNDDGEMVDPVTFKVFTDNTHLVALKNTGNVFAHDTVERLNVKAKNWRDLVSEEEFNRKDIITLQDPQNVESRNLSTFKYLQEGADTLTLDQQRERNDPSRNVNSKALGNGAALIKPKSKKDEIPNDINPDALSSNRASITKTLSSLSKPSSKLRPTQTAASKPTPPAPSSRNAHALHTTGLAAASFTSTGLTPHTTADLATLSQESYLLHPRRVRTKGYVHIALSPSSLGNLTLELAPEFAPKAVYNFIKLAKKGYYNGVTFHRNIRGFMIQGGDPTGTGKGGSSYWNKEFDDELDGPLKFDKKGVLAMANKGKNSNGSQFFITYRQTPHLARKHTIFGTVVEDISFETLKRLEAAEADEKGRPKEEVVMREVNVLVDPFETFLEMEDEGARVEREREEVRKRGGAEDERVTWTGKRVRGDRGLEAGKVEEGGAVGKYLKTAAGDDEDRVKRNGDSGGGKMLEEWDTPSEPAKKKIKGGGFGNFDSW